MQIMPATWVELSARHDLGIDPFDPHDNIMAGAAYLREMLDRFGSEGFLAAYNAGPERYEQHLTTGRTLPNETQAYVTRITPLIGLERRKSGGPAARQVVLRQQAPVFVERCGSSSAADKCAPGVRTMNSSKPATKAVATALVPRATGLFVHRSVKVQSP
ncbi:lytic transglycosylase domain-containing protein [Bradyrhizobium sp. SSUT77]|uniref:lytic transglycosylase domain-containing protein n=1 Tax=Bradyrhizobium sp. SSUT77 TaxID=3040603 RepID=UPI003265307F